MTDVLHKTLIIRLSSIGDIVLSSLLVRTLRKRFPESRIDFCVKEEFAELVRWNPYLTGVVEFPRSGNFRMLRDLRKHIAREHYDLIIDIHDSLRSRFLSWGASRVVRIRKRKYARFLLVRFKLNIYGMFGGAPSVALRYIEPVKECGVGDDGMGLDFFIPPGTRHQVEDMIRSAALVENPGFIGVCPSAKHGNKMWLKERFAEVAATLARQHMCPIVIFGSLADVDRCNAIVALLHEQNNESRILNLAGKLTLAESAAMMDRCLVVITNDSGLMHIAAARKRKVVAIFGPTVKELGFFPFGTENRVVEKAGLACRPCTHIGLPQCPKGHFQCMHDISTAEVVASANSLLES